VWGTDVRALVIEDQPLLAWVLEEILHEHGILEVDSATSEPQAIASAQQNCPDVLIADDHISSGSGVAAIRAICVGKYIPTIFVTADARSVRRSLPDAMIIEKPLLETALIDALEIVLPQKSGKCTPPTDGSTCPDRRQSADLTGAC
jgi:CheY-like chemotaxis protein